MAAQQGPRRIFLCKWPKHEVTMVYAENEDNARQVLEYKCQLFGVPSNKVTIKELDKTFALEFRLKTPKRINANSAISEIRGQLQNCELLLHLRAVNDEISAAPGVGLELQSMQAHDNYGETAFGQAGWAVQTAIARHFFPGVYGALHNYVTVDQGGGEGRLPAATRQLYQEIAQYIPADSDTAVLAADGPDDGEDGDGGDDDDNDDGDTRSTDRSPESKTPKAGPTQGGAPGCTPTSNPSSTKSGAAGTSGGKPVEAGAPGVVMPRSLLTHLNQAAEPREVKATSSNKDSSASSWRVTARPSKSDAGRAEVLAASQVDLTGDSDDEVNLVSDSHDEPAAASSSTNDVKGKAGPTPAPTGQAANTSGSGGSGPAIRSRAAGAAAKKPSLV